MNLQFIEPEIGGINKKEYLPASYVRKEFIAKDGIRSAVMHITALGTYVGYLNGKELDGQMQRPGFTNYDARLQYQTYDVTKQIVPGENTIAAIVGDGWYRGTLGGDKKYFYGEKIKLAVLLELTYLSGEKEDICTNESWMATQEGPIRKNDQKVIEKVDMTKEMSGWDAPGFKMDSRWHSCVRSSYRGELIPQEGERLVEQESLKPVVLRTPDGEKILDFRQNHCGHVEFSVTGTAGTTVSLIMGETLDENGNFTTQNITPANKKKPVDWQRLTYTLKEGMQTYKSKFLMSGYRYVRLENWPEEIQAENFISRAIYSELKPSGSFSCSDADINQLVSNVLWSQKSNFVDIPTDCPQRERAGWAGDINVFCETANYFMKTDRFLEKWLNDFVSVAGEDGNLPYVVPRIPMGDVTNGSAGWSDAISNVPYILYQFYGDQSVIEKVYPTVKAYVDFNERRAAKKNIRHLFKLGKHYRYILDTGYHYGEWMEPGSSLMKDGLKGMISPDAEVATAWWYYTTAQLTKMAKILEKKEDETKYARLAANIKAAYRTEFLRNGTVKSGRMCRYVRPLYMGLTYGDEARHIASELNALCISNDYKIGTGFLTTYKLLPTLCDYGYTDTAYKMLLNEAYPGWMYAVKHGATTTWENWNGIDEKGVPHDSLNHYSAGSVAAWLFGYCGGIRPQEPGFKRVLIRPIPGGGLSWAKTEYVSCRGRISTEWKINQNKFTLKVKTPAETTVVMPDGVIYERSAGEYQFTCAKECLTAGQSAEQTTEG